MTEKLAMEKGYEYTGCYSRDKEDLKITQRNKFSSQGYKSVIITKKDNPLSRGPIGVGYSIYAEKKYRIDIAIQDLENKLNDISNRKTEATEEFNKIIASIENDKSKFEKQLMEWKFIRQIKK